MANFPLYVDDGSEHRTPARDAFHVAYAALRQAVLSSPAWQGEDGPTNQEMCAMAWAIGLLADRCWKWTDDGEANHHWIALASRATKVMDAHWQAGKAALSEESATSTTPP